MCTCDRRLVFPIHQLELLVERILNEINEFIEKVHLDDLGVYLDMLEMQIFSDHQH